LNEDALGITESFERIEIDWLKMRIRYHGIADVKDTNTWAESEKAALGEGLNHLVANLPQMAKGREFAKNDFFTSKMAYNIASATYISNLELNADGRVRVDLESAIGIVLAQSGGLEFVRDLAEESQDSHTRLVLELSNEVKPMPVYQLVDSDGDILFSVGDVAKKEFERRMMGRWFSGQERAKALTGKPFILKAEPIGKGQFQVDEDRWEQFKDANVGLIQRAKIALILP
jgi:hypothetical protein